MLPVSVKNVTGPIERIVQTALSEQAPTVILHNPFCMAECYLKIKNPRIVN